MSLCDCYIACGEGEYIVTGIIPVLCGCVCIPKHIHCLCRTAMALLCIPVSELISFALSTIPIMSLKEECVWSYIYKSRSYPASKS